MLALRLLGSALVSASIINGQVDLGSALSFGVLAGTVVTNGGPTTILGNVGVFPGTAIVGLSAASVSDGSFHSGDPVANQAQFDVLAAYNAAAAYTSDLDLTGHDLAGLILVAGVYSFSSTAQLSGVLTLDGQGDPDSVFIIQIGSALTTAAHSVVNLVNGASSCNVFWQIGTSATLGAANNFAGNVLALASITLGAVSKSDGGLYAHNGVVTLDTNEVDGPIDCPGIVCATPIQSTATPTPSST